MIVYTTWYAVNMTDRILYRFFDSSGALLYIGITETFGARLVAHEATKPWFADVAAISIERHPSRSALAEAEAEAVRREQPLHNLVRFTGPTKLRSFRIDADLYDAAQAEAAERGETVTSVIVAAFAEYLDER